LDQWQKRGAIESPDGPQRIRGLAGSGKTVVLALKAAYLHAQHPEWNIGVTFSTRSLYAQFQDFIRRFSFEHSNDEPDWSKLRVLHAWGTPREPGIYSVLAAAHGLPVHDFSAAKAAWGRTDAFDGCCREVVAAAAQKRVAPLFDALIMDEAQDFPPSFFEMVYGHLDEPKRLIWAYDELQSLNETTMPPLAKLFGLGANGEPKVKLLNEHGKPHQDIILPVCYRNPPWTLSIAHALGFGIYRNGGGPSNLVQMFDEAGLWRDIGYEVAGGSLEPQAQVALQRRQDASPEFFARLLQPSDAFVAGKFDSEQAQAAWVAQEIAKNIREDELEPADILVIFPNPITVPNDSGPLVAALRELGIESHIAGVTSRRDQFFVEGSVTISGIYRAKGNEAPMVYLLSSDHCAQGPELLKRRNTAFTALTRSRAWVRMYGVGPRMDALLHEIQHIRDRGYRLEFTVPTDAELARMRSIHRDRTEGEKQNVEATADAAAALVEELQAGRVTLDDLPPKVRKQLARLLKEA
jgi:superfamily I DNA and RNA helicase